MNEDMINEKQTLNMRFAIISIIAFIGLSLFVAIMFNVLQIINHISIEQALQSDVDDALFNVVATRMQTKDISIHRIAVHNNWHAVAVSSLAPTDYSSSSLAVLLQNNGTYEIIFIGSDYDKTTLEAKGVPSEVIKTALSSDLISSYTNVLADSQYNPNNKYTLLQQLPYQTDGLKMSYYYDDVKDSDGTNIPIIKVNAKNPTERKNAIRKIRLFGYDPGDYRIQFINFRNAFDKNRIIINNPSDYYVEGEQAP